MKRQNYISWDIYFMGIAKLSAQRSKDPHTQVGCCIVDTDNHIVGAGYNGFACGCSDDLFPWDKTAKKLSDTKFPYVVHAEANAILNSTTSLKGATLYTTLFPCTECTKLIIQSGIKTIVYISDKNNGKEDNFIAKRMLETVKINLIKMQDFKLIL